MKMGVKVLFIDVDGTLTDGKIYLGTNGEEVMKVFSVKDGSVLHKLFPVHNVMPVILTGRNSIIVKKRCDELDIPGCHLAVKDKLSLIKSYQDRYEPSSFSYIGDDANDLSSIRYINSMGGITACPADAVPTVKQEVSFICEHRGGDGAVRDFVEYMIANKILKKGEYV